MEEKNITIEDIQNAKDDKERAELGRKYMEQAAATLERGKIRLKKPIEDGERRIEEIEFDFSEITTDELTKALATGEKRPDLNDITEKQAINLFCAAAAKKTPGIFPNDIKEQLGLMDAMNAIKIAKSFFLATSRAGSFLLTNT